LITASTVFILIVWFVLYKYFGKKLVMALRDFLRQFFDYRKRPRKVFLALACSIMLTLCNVIAFWFCVHAMHISLAFVPILLTLSFGVALGSATPTPGGLGGVEAGMVAGLVLYRVDSATALAAVLVYRLISYWLPLIIGAACFVYTQRRNYI
jgi:uncharacterized protein (TIRG00374 family)